MRLKKILACCSLMAAALNASAGIELTFEDRGLTYSALGSPYAGVKFVGSPFTYGAVGAGGLGNFAGQVDADHLTNNVALWMNSSDVISGDPSTLVINLDAGFSTLFKMLYTTLDSWEGTGVQVFSGLNGTGDLLGSSGAFSFVAQPGCEADIACRWAGVNIDLGKSIARSVVISAPDATYFFDNLFFGDLPAGTGGGDVPEPAGAALTLAALSALAITRRRSKR